MKSSVLSLMLLGGGAFAAETLPQVGQAAPDFTLPSQDGSKISLHDFKGKRVVLYFYPKDGTAGCMIEAHNFQRDLAKYEQNHSVIVGVSVDSTNSHQEFCAKQGLTFKLLADTEKAVSRQYGSLTSLFVYKISARNTFLVNPQGRIARVWTGVSPARHSGEVLAALTQLAPKSASPGEIRATSGKILSPSEGSRIPQFASLGAREAIVGRLHTSIVPLRRDTQSDVSRQGRTLGTCQDF